MQVETLDATVRDYINELEMLRIKKLHPAWGAKKIPEIYKRNHTGKYAPVRGSVENLFVRAGYTKYILAIDAVEKGDTASVKGVFQRVFKQFGIPQCIRSDNGPPSESVEKC
jgi:hypothetical protein